MATRREVLDSDDEDSLGPLGGPTPEPLSGEEATTHNVDDGLDASRSRRAESTDPSFFRNIYEEHHVATRNQSQNTSNGCILAGSDDDHLGNHQCDNLRPSSVTSPVAPNSDKHESSHLSSITDPVAGNRERRMAEKKKAVDPTLTQVTTPGRPQLSADSDIWDIPPTQNESPAAGSSHKTSSGTKTTSVKVKKTERKRKSDLSSSVQTPNSPETGSLRALTVQPTGGAGRPAGRKRQRLSEVQQGRGSQDVDMLVIPRSEETAQFKTSPTVPNTSSGDVVENTHGPHSASLFIVPNTLTPSQKEQYQFVSLSTEAAETPEKVILREEVDMTGSTHKSSGTSSVAHPAANVPDSTLPPMLPAMEPRASVLMKTLAKMKKRPTPVRKNLPSSPDVISEPLKDGPSARGQQGPNADLVPAAEEESVAMASTISPPSARRRRNVHLAEENPYALPSTISPPPSSAIRRGRARKVRQSNVVPEADMGPVLFAEQVEPPKRGRGRPKRLRSGTVGQDDDDLQAAIAASLADLEAQTNNPEARVAATSAPESATATHEETVEVEQEPKPVDNPASANEGTPTVAFEQPQPKKKRGRKKKGPADVEPVPLDGSVAPVSDAVSVLFPEVEAEEPKPRRKRGRPRKPEPAVVTEAETLPDMPSEPDKQGASPVDHGVDTHDEEKHVEERPAKKAKKNPRTVDEAAGDGAVSVLSERDNNSARGGAQTKSESPTMDAKDTTAQENIEVETPVKQVTKKDETPKPGLLSSQTGKVQYRVGLSKKTRIAPLLKSLRKP